MARRRKEEVASDFSQPLAITKNVWRLEEELASDFSWPSIIAKNVLYKRQLQFM